MNPSETVQAVANAICRAICDRFSLSADEAETAAREAIIALKNKQMDPIQLHYFVNTIGTCTHPTFRLIGKVVNGETVFECSCGRVFK